MTEETFDKLVERRCEKIKEILSIKGKEYRRNSNPLHNFERGANIAGKRRETVLNGFMLKHYISLQDILDDWEHEGKVPDTEIVDEKIGDLMNYLVLLEACLKDNYKHLSDWQTPAEEEVGGKRVPDYLKYPDSDLNAVPEEELPTVENATEEQKEAFKDKVAKHAANSQQANYIKELEKRVNELTKQLDETTMGAEQDKRVLKERIENLKDKFSSAEKALAKQSQTATKPQSVKQEFAFTGNSVRGVGEYMLIIRGNGTYYVEHQRTGEVSEDIPNERVHSFLIAGDDRFGRMCETEIQMYPAT